MGNFLFALISYLIAMSSLAAFFWYLAFQTDTAAIPFSWNAVAFDVLIFLIFPLQHSLLPRARIKDWIQKRFGPMMERPIYVGTSGIALWLILWSWRPMGPVIYKFSNPIFFQALFFAALFFIIVSTIALDHSSMFGLKQGLYAWKKKTMPLSTFQTTGIYGIVRHPITSLLLVCLWSHATMTAGRLLLNLLFTLYSILGLFLKKEI